MISPTLKASLKQSKRTSAILTPYPLWPHFVPSAFQPLPEIPRTTLQGADTGVAVEYVTPKHDLEFTEVSTYIFMSSQNMKAAECKLKFR